MFFLGLRVGIGLQGGGDVGRLCRRFTQVAHATAAAQVRRLLLFVGEWHTVAEAAVEMVGSEIEIAHLFFVAVAVGVSAFFGETVAVAQIAVAALIGEVERLDLCLIEGEQLAFLADAVLIEVAPDTQVSESVVGSIHLAVAVVIEFFQCLIAVGGTFAIFQQGVVAEKLAAVIDDAITVTVINEETVIFAYPASSGADAVFVVVEECAFMAITGNCFNTVAVKVKSKRVIDDDTIFTGQIVPIFMIASKPVPALAKQGTNTPAYLECTIKHQACQGEFTYENIRCTH